MQVDLIKIGNSQGIRLPKAVIAQLELKDTLELEVSDGAIVIRSVKRPRSGWAKAAAQCRSAGDDAFDEWDAVTGDFDGQLQ